MLTESLLSLTVMAVHRLESTSKHWALLYFLPVMQHIAILNGTGNFITATRDNFVLIFPNRLFQGYLTVSNAANCFQEVGGIANTVVKALATV